MTHWHDIPAVRSGVIKKQNKMSNKIEMEKAHATQQNKQQQPWTAVIFAWVLFSEPSIFNRSICVPSVENGQSMWIYLKELWNFTLNMMDAALNKTTPYKIHKFVISRHSNFNKICIIFLFLSLYDNWRESVCKYTSTLWIRVTQHNQDSMHEIKFHPIMLVIVVLLKQWCWTSFGQ